ncbi:MAG: hypothetical protein ACOYOK_02880 [Pseudobdellovibrionaceae bacterium]
MKTLFYGLILFLILNAKLSFAQTPSSAELTVLNTQTSEDLEIQLKAKQRLYPGGAEETDLKIQNPLPTAHRKMGTDASAADEAVSEE